MFSQFYFPNVIILKQIVCFSSSISDSKSSIKESQITRLFLFSIINIKIENVELETIEKPFNFLNKHVIDGIKNAFHFYSI